MTTLEKMRLASAEIRRQKEEIKARIKARLIAEGKKNYEMNDATLERMMENGEY